MILTGRDYYRSFVGLSVWTSTDLVRAQDEKTIAKQMVGWGFMPIHHR